MAAPIHSPRIRIDHPNGRERAGGVQSSVRLSILVGKSDLARDVVLARGRDDADLVRLIHEAVHALAILRGVR